MRAVIFDLDGVVVNTAKYHYLGWKKLAKELGFDFDISHNERLKGVSRMESLNFVLDVVAPLDAAFVTVTSGLFNKPVVPNLENPT